MHKNLITGLTTMVMIGASMAAHAQSDASSMTERNVKQQQRIEQGLESGALNTREAARLERGQARVDRMEAQALKDGQLSEQERARIDKAQDTQSRAIYSQKHDAQTADPTSQSSQRMRTAVRRDVNQQQRIDDGVKNGSLTNQEVAKLQRGQAANSRQQARFGRDGEVGAGESVRMARHENRQSARIARRKHDAHVAPVK
ncbi:MAG TPA: hypothetical protein VFS42_04325 [Burkholderiaceae bacterium]|nr:hypothetical protein [Burkholderiaceae bacterium]